MEGRPGRASTWRFGRSTHAGRKRADQVRVSWLIRSFRRRRHVLAGSVAACVFVCAHLLAPLYMAAGLCHMQMRHVRTLRADDPLRSTHGSGAFSKHPTAHCTLPNTHYRAPNASATICERHAVADSCITRSPRSPDPAERSWVHLLSLPLPLRWTSAASQLRRPSHCPQ